MYIYALSLCISTMADSESAHLITPKSVGSTRNYAEGRVKCFLGDLLQFRERQSRFKTEKARPLNTRTNLIVRCKQKIKARETSIL